MASDVIIDRSHPDYLRERIAELEAQLHSVSSTYGDLVRLYPVVAERIESHEWDNKTPSEQRDWALTQLAERDWSPITQDNLPRVGDEIGAFWPGDETYPVRHVQPYEAKKSPAAWIRQGQGWSHRRPINAPLAAPYGEDETK